MMLGIVYDDLTTGVIYTIWFDSFSERCLFDLCWDIVYTTKYSKSGQKLIRVVNKRCSKNYSMNILVPQIKNIATDENDRKLRGQRKKSVDDESLFVDVLYKYFGKRTHLR